MDVGAPNNFERMQALYHGDLDALRRDIVGVAYDDARVVAEIGKVYREVIGRHFPAMAVVEVRALVEPQALVEIEAMAVVPD